MPLIGALATAWLAMPVAISNGLDAISDPIATPTEPAEPDPTFHTPEETLKRIQVPDGYTVELAAAEPLLYEPAMVTWDANGLMYVLELNTYMQDIDGKGQHEPICRIITLQDTTGDGRKDTKTIFADGLVLPRFVMPLEKGRVLIRETNTLDVYMHVDENGDGKADRRELAFKMERGTGSDRGNLEHQDSALTWGVDNWLYSSMSGARHRYQNGEWISEPVNHSFGQWGLAQDEVGRLFYATAGRESPVYGFQQHPTYGKLNLSGQLGNGFNNVFPIVQTPDVQGGTRRVSQHNTLNHFTGHAGQSIFLGHRLPGDLVGDYILPEPVGRFVRRASVENVDGKIVLNNAYENHEFIASTDMNFRPIWSATGPDGKLYIVDMYRGIIQEGNWVRKGSYLREQVEKLGLQDNIGRGRIYRIVHQDFERDMTRPRMFEQSDSELLLHLNHPNAWWRIEAQKQLVLRNATSVIPDLERMARTADNPLTRVHALWTLDALGQPADAVLVAAFADQDYRVRKTAIRVAEPRIKEDPDTVLPMLRSLVDDAHPNVLGQLVLSLRYGGVDGQVMIHQVNEKHPDNQLIKAFAEQSLNALVGSGGEPLPRLPSEAMESYLRGRDIYSAACAMCHGDDGKGQPAGDLLLGSSLVDSTLAHQPNAAIRVVLHGSTAGSEKERYANMMAPMGDNDDEWIADVLTYVQAEHGGGGPVSADHVAQVRQETADRDRPYRPGELDIYHPLPLEHIQQWGFDASHNARSLRNIVDGNAQNRWASGTSQNPDMWLSIDMKKPHLVTTLTLDTSGAANDYPREYEVQISEDGQQWSEPIVSGQGHGPVTKIVLPSGIVTQHLRIRQTGKVGHWHWSIYQLSVSGKLVP